MLDLLLKAQSLFLTKHLLILLHYFIIFGFFHVKKAKLNAYADDHQVYYSHVDPAALDACVSHDVGVANQWYHENGMLVNESKHQCLILGDTEYGFSFPVKDTLEIFGMEIDNKLNFSKHISNVCKKINNQFNVMLRFRKLIRREILFKLYKAYILPQFIIAPLSGTFVERAMQISLKL